MGRRREIKKKGRRETNLGSIFPVTCPGEIGDFVPGDSIGEGGKNGFYYFRLGESPSDR